MTNPMLAELDEVVRLMDAATPGPWALEHERGGDVSIVNREHQGDGWDIATAHYTQPANAELIARSVNFLRTHHATLADMAKRLEALQYLAAAMYQAAGAYDMPVRFLDVLSAAGNGEPITEEQVDALLPCETPDTLQRLEAAERDAARYRWLRDVWGGWMAVGSKMRVDVRTPLWSGDWDSFDEAIDDIAAIDATQEGEG